MGRENLVTQVATTKEKGLTYRETIIRFNRALNNEFYFEALLIDGVLMRTGFIAICTILACLPCGHIEAHAPMQRIVNKIKFHDAIRKAAGLKTTQRI